MVGVSVGHGLIVRVGICVGVGVRVMVGNGTGVVVRAYTMGGLRPLADVGEMGGDGVGDGITVGIDVTVSVGVAIGLEIASHPANPGKSNKESNKLPTLKNAFFFILAHFCGSLPPSEMQLSRAAFGDVGSSHRLGGPVSICVPQHQRQVDMIWREAQDDQPALCIGNIGVEP